MFNTLFTKTLTVTTRFSSLLILLGFTGSASLGQSWEDVTGNIPGGIPFVEISGPLASDGTNLFVNLSNGVVRTTDGGSFTQTADIDRGLWRFVKVVNGEVWVGDGISSMHFTYLWRSSDLGATWNAASNGMPGDVDLITIEDVTYDEDTGTYWAASPFGGAYRSTDGTNWTQQRVGLPQAPFVGYSLAEFIVAEGGDAMVGMLGDGNIVGAGVFRTQNDGASWSKLPEVVAGTPGNFLKIGNRILYTTSGINSITGGLFISEDFGDTWTYQDQWLKTAYSMSTDGTTVFACKGGDVWFSANQGDSWDRLDTTGLTLGWNAVAIEKVGNNLFLLSEENNIGKLYRMDVSGFQFVASTQITLQPLGDEVLEGNAITLEGDAVGTGTVTYRWQKDGVNIAGATSKTLMIDPLTLSDAGAYTLIATANGQSATSSVATVVVKNRNIGAPDPQFLISEYINGKVGASVIDPDGNVWYTGAFTVNNNAIIKVDPTEGTILASLGGALEGTSAALDSMGKVWIGNNNAQLHRITPGAATIDFSVDINLGVNSGRVNSIAPYGDEGKVLIAGFFDKVAGVDTGPMALLNHDGTVDTSFNVLTGGMTDTEIFGVDVGPDLQIHVTSASYSTFPNKTQTVARINADGTLDTTWWAGGKNPSEDKSNVQGEIHSLKILVDGSILVGTRHTFGSNPTVFPDGLQHIFKLKPDGSWDSSFNKGGIGPGGGVGSVLGIHIAPDGKIIINGDFDTYNGATYTSSNKNITRLLADGSPDPYWNPGMEGWRGTVYAVSIDEAGNIFGGANHTWYNGTNMSRILKIAGDVSPIAILGHPVPLTILGLGETVTFKVHAFGTTALLYQWRKDGVDIPGATSDTLEITGIDDTNDAYYDVVVSNASGQLISEQARLMTISVPKFVIQPEAQNIMVGDELTLSVEAIGLGDLDYQWHFEDGAIDGATGSSYTIPFSSISNSGSYTVEVTGSAGTSISAKTLVYVEPFAGALDLSFNVNPGFNGTVYDMLGIDDGSLIVGGAFSQFKGVNRQYIAKVDSSGNLDETWPQAGAPNIWVRTLQKLDDDKLLLGGPFNDSNGWETGIVRMNLDGTVDTSFNSAGNRL